ncbi:MAG: hypothetical protein EOP63_05500 [Sphingomonadales bacterium]|nr:MAG: hypothetical protein EOP63_05500 [Sphingomonadales bacterium]
MTSIDRLLTSRSFSTVNKMKCLALLLAISLSACAGTASRGGLARATSQCDEVGDGPREQSREDLPVNNAVIDKHRQLRADLGEPMPNEPTMILLHAAGGHLATSEYSIIAYRSADERWRGTAVGRSKIWIEGASFRPMDKREWVLAAEAAKRLDRILDDRCFYAEPRTFGGEGGPPSRGAMFVQLDVITPTNQRSARYLVGYARGLTAEVDRFARPK